MTAEIWVGYALLGACVGVLSGLFGIGGGLIIVPALVWSLPRQGVPDSLVILMAVATSLATITLTSVSAVLAHCRMGALPWRPVWRLTPGILIGAAAGSKLASLLPVEVLKTCFGGFLLLVAVQMATEWRPRAGARDPGVWVYGLAGLGIGALSAIIGIGGGSLTVPFLVRVRYALRGAVAASSACGFPLAVSGALSYVLLGWGREGLPEGSLGYVYLPALVGIVASSMLLAPAGAWLAGWLPARSLKRAFAMLLVVVGIKMLWR